VDENRNISSEFHWGVAGSAFQSEGDIPPCNWGIYLSDGLHPDLEPYRNAIDFRHKYRDDIALARDLGAQVFWFGVSWARVEPAQGTTDSHGWAFYRDVTMAIIDAGMEPMPTLDHFVYPEWIFQQGGWVNPSTVDHFIDYVAAAVAELGHACRWWLVFNEPSVNVLMETKMRGLTQDQSLAMASNLVHAHVRSYELIKAADNGAQISSNEATGNLPMPARARADALFLDQVADAHLDFIGLDNYYPNITDEAMAQINQRTPWLIPQSADGIGPVAEYYANRYPGLPIFIIETGMPTDNGALRADGLTRSRQLLNAVDSIRRA
jgi:beta-glucosidase